MTPALLNALGVVCQLVGVMVAFVGLWKTWHEFAGGERFRDPYVARARAIGAGVGAWLRSMTRRLLRRPARRVIEVGAMDSLSASGTVRTRVIWGPLPTTTKPALAELHRRTLELSKTQADATERLDAALEEVRTRAAASGSRLEEAIKGLQALNRQVAIGGVRWEASGLFLVLLGLALQGIAAAFGSAT